MLIVDYIYREMILLGKIVHVFGHVRRAKSDGSSGEKYDICTDEVTDISLRRHEFQRRSLQSHVLFVTSL
jgi:hypothetical protein